MKDKSELEYQAGGEEDEGPEEEGKKPPESAPDRKGAQDAEEDKEKEGEDGGQDPETGGVNEESAEQYEDHNFAPPQVKIGFRVVMVHSFD